MAATPKRKISNTRRKHRRVNLVLKVCQTHPCSKCKMTVKPHNVCKNCGTYNR